MVERKREAEKDSSWSKQIAEVVLRSGELDPWLDIVVVFFIWWFPTFFSQFGDVSCSELPW
jgi:hypothetical protein